MAYTAGNIGDQTGIGQGLAFVLPDGKAGAYAMQLAQTHAQQLQDMVRQKQAAQAKLNEQYQKDFKDQQLPAAFAPFDKELNDRFNKWLQKGAAQFAQTGKNPYNDPDFMKEYNSDVLTPARQSQELGQNYTKLRATAETDPGNKYTKASKQAVIDYEKTIKDDPFKALTQPLPQLEETPASADDLVKTLKATSVKTDDGTWETKGPDSSSHKAQAFAALVGDDKWHPLLKSYGYNPDLPDFGVYSDPKSPTGKRVWYTNPTFTGHMADQILESPEDPKSQRILQTLGIDIKTDKFAREKLQHAISDQNEAMGRAVTDISTRKDAEVPVEKQRKFGEERLEIAEKNLSLSEQRLAFQKEKQDAKVYYGKNLIERMGEGEQGAGEELSEFYKANPNYNAHLHFSTTEGGDKIAIQVPEKMKANPNYNAALPVSALNSPQIVAQKGYTVHLDKNKPFEFKAGMVQILKNVGIPASADKIMAPNPHENKPTTPEPQYKTSIKKSDIAAKAAAAGYSTEEYMNLLKQKGIKIE